MLHVQDWSENQKESPEQCSGLEWKSEAQSRTSVIWPPVRRGSAKLFHGRQQHVGQPKTKENELSLAMFEGGNMALLQLRLVVHQEHSTGSVHQGLPVCHWSLSLGRMMVFFCRASDWKMHKIAHEEDSWICKVECEESHVTFLPVRNKKSWILQTSPSTFLFCSTFRSFTVLLLPSNVVVNHGNATMSYGGSFGKVNGHWRLQILEPRISENCCKHNNFLTFESWFGAKNDIKMSNRICKHSSLSLFRSSELESQLGNLFCISIHHQNAFWRSLSLWQCKLKHLIDPHTLLDFCRETKMIVFDHCSLCTFLPLTELLLQQLSWWWVASNECDMKWQQWHGRFANTSICGQINLKMHPMFCSLKLSDLAWQQGLRGSLVVIKCLAFWQNC